MQPRKPLHAIKNRQKPLSHQRLHACTDRSPLWASEVSFPSVIELLPLVTFGVRRVGWMDGPRCDLIGSEQPGKLPLGKLATLPFGPSTFRVQGQFLDHD